MTIKGSEGRCSATGYCGTCAINLTIPLKTRCRTPSDAARLIHFIHPAYETKYQLFRLPSFDGEGAGLHHHTVLTACGVVACNEWDGYLTTCLTGLRLDPRLGPPLTAPWYYFFVPHEDYP